MHNVLILGGGKIGSLIAAMLHATGDYEVHVADASGSDCEAGTTRALGDHTLDRVHTLDVADTSALEDFVRRHETGAILSSLPYYCNPPVAEIARKVGCHYFDLTEDVEVTRKVSALAEGANRAFVPQCGLAPGFISIAANELMQQFDEIETVKMRVGALPQNPSNVLKYSLTWSTEGLINEYGNMCYGIADGESIAMQPLEGLETIQIDGADYEAFNTSGGLGSLADTYAGRVRNLTYKTVRYPGHCRLMRVLMNDLKLNDDRATLKRILESSVPRTDQDVVIVYVAVIGRREGALYEMNDVRKIYPAEIGGRIWSAIQVTTASGICGVLDLVLANPDQYRGLVAQEAFPLPDFLKNRLGRYYATI